MKRRTRLRTPRLLTAAAAAALFALTPPATWGGSGEGAGGGGGGTGWASASPLSPSFPFHRTRRAASSANCVDSYELALDRHFLESKPCLCIFTPFPTFYLLQQVRGVQTQNNQFLKKVSHFKKVIVARLVWYSHAFLCIPLHVTSQCVCVHGGGRQPGVHLRLS